jgi:hippurate hydrolase
MTRSLPEAVGMTSATFDKLVALRRDLHRQPELSDQETRTAQRVQEYLEELGLSPRCGVGGTGVVVEIPGEAGGPLVALRADMDALPVQEDTGLPFSSEVPGVMHACGHDAHTAIVLGAAELLVAGPPPPVTVRLLFQPAEETGRGAQAMIAAGALEGVGMIFGGHVDRHYPPGFLAIAEGGVNASTDSFTIRISGRGGHGARPHEALDAVVVGSLMVMAIQTIVSREVDPAHPSVVSVGRFDAGTAHNVIAGEATLAGTIRSQHPPVRDHLKRSIRRIAESVGALHGAQVVVEIEEGSPPVVNPPDMAALAKEAAIAVVGEDGVGPLHTTNMGGEDFGYYAELVPACYVRYGSRVDGFESEPAHSGRFMVHEDVIAVGGAYLAEVARRAGVRLLGEGK